MPEAPAAPPVSTPSPAPASVPAAAPAAPAHSPQPASAQGKPNLTSAFDNLDKIVAETSVSNQPEPKTPAPNPDDDPNTPADQPPKAPETTAKPATPPAAAQPQKAKTLREAKEMAEAQLKELQAKHAELEARLSKAVDEKKVKEYEEKLTASEKRIAELDEKLRYTDYSQSQEYKDKYEAPFVKAYTTGLQKVKSLKVTVPGKADEVTGVETPATTRAATDADFERLMDIVDDGEATQYAAQLFGNGAPIALYHREQVQALNAARAEALKEFREKGSARAKEQADLTQKQEQELSSAYKASIDDAVKQFPMWFQPKEGDAKDKQLLEQGMAWADRAFDKKALDALPPKERAGMFAALRNKAGAFDVMVYRSVQLQKRLTEVEAKLKDYEGTEPGDGGTNRRPKPAGGTGESLDSVDSQIEKMAGIGR